ncbi:hypothetical protein L1987_15692 [Smallanthus sonchifolius]|uniref:Uncharacterized protein n=1 Tax=Smallanthus sonchifolius TaxID=185202 RepID=A0ACB9J6M5_9ASTR|nr:hypothetical protein L1987_15692 [Smallanthus sonchifolius]
MQRVDVVENTDQYPVSPTYEVISRGSKHRVVEHLKQEVILGEHQEESKKVEMTNKSRLALIQASEEDQDDDEVW